MLAPYTRRKHNPSALHYLYLRSYHFYTNNALPKLAYVNELLDKVTAEPVITDPSTVLNDSGLDQVSQEGSAEKSYSIDQGITQCDTISAGLCVVNDPSKLLNRDSEAEGILIQPSPKRNKSSEHQQCKREADIAVCFSNPFATLQSDDEPGLAIPADVSGIEDCNPALVNTRGAAAKVGELSSELELSSQNAMFVDGDVEAHRLAGRAGLPRIFSIFVDLRKTNASNGGQASSLSNAEANCLDMGVGFAQENHNCGKVLPSLPCTESRLTQLRRNVRQVMEVIGARAQLVNSINAVSTRIE
ncbi:hypothetical protein Nepgr_002776 [Nepenthes gracilis]|uniref:Uncharacterized protein n=1 Tax=Nepenthes gracilis TaxID=150966 RepID=A0AAD3PAB2_NEPGR|nr:hypothetical protein Nepgr_002776 [Nepenthes gracilis]